MDFQGRYQILEMLTDGEARTFKARQTSSGRTVLLHQLWVERTPPHQPDLASLVFGFLRRASAEDMKVLIDMGEEGGRVFVVTEDLPVFHDLRQWLQSAAGTPETAGKASVSKPAPSADARGGGVTRGLTSQSRQESPASPDAMQRLTSPKGPKPPIPPPLPTKAKEQAGEFTRVFFGKDMPISKSAEPVSPPPEKVSAPPASMAEKPPEGASAVGFEAAIASRQGQSRAPQQPTIERPSPPPTSAPGPGQGAAGDFTRIFFGTDEAKAMPPSSTPTAATTGVTPVGPALPPQPEGPGEFTRLFRAQEVNEGPPAEAPVGAEPRPSFPSVQPTEQQGPGEFTLLFRPSPEVARTAGPPTAPTSPRPAASLPGPSSQQSPGELTQLLKGYQPGKSAPPPTVFEGPEPEAAPPPPKVEEAQPGAFTMIFRQPPVPAQPAVAPPVLQTPPPGPQTPEQDEYMRMFELPGGGGGASPQGASSGPLPAAPQPAAGRALPAIPMAPVSPPMVPGIPQVQPPVVPMPMVPQPQPYQIPTPQFQQPPAPPAFAMPVQPVMPQMQPVAVPVPAPPQAVPPQPGKGKFLVPLLILGGLFVIAVVVIVIFALKH